MTICKRRKSMLCRNAYIGLRFISSLVYVERINVLGRCKQENIPRIIQIIQSPPALKAWRWRGGVTCLLPTCLRFSLFFIWFKKAYLLHYTPGRGAVWKQNDIRLPGRWKLHPLVTASLRWILFDSRKGLWACELRRRMSSGAALDGWARKGEVESLSTGQVLSHWPS